VLGAAVAVGLKYLQSRFSWLPFHPAALAFPVCPYVLSLLLVWLSKAVVLRYGGGRLYRRSLLL
jgi:hypothetical protein